MRKCGQLKKQSILFYVLMFILFLAILVLNFLTDYVADDWVYMFSFSTREPIRVVRDIFPSMYVHSTHMNGRLISHGLVQLMFIFRRPVFKLVNTGVYCAVMYMLYRFCVGRGKRSNLLFAGLSMTFLVTMPAFGEVCLWQVGAINYIWALLFCLLWLWPFLRFYRDGDDPFPHLWQRIPVILLSIPFGMYSEITSFIAIVAGVALTILGMFRCKKRWSWLWLAVALACVGYALLLLMPAESAKTATEMTLNVLIANIGAFTELMRAELLPLYLGWAILFALGISMRLDRQQLILSGGFALAGTMAGYMLVVGTYMPSRTLCTTTLMLLIAIGVLAADLLETGYRKVCVCLTAALTVLSLITFAPGAADLWSNHQQFLAREDYIHQCIAEGQEDLTLKLITASTDFSPYRYLKDLDSGTSQDWPNLSMSKYYGLNSIIGQP